MTEALFDLEPTRFVHEGTHLRKAEWRVRDVSRSTGEALVRRYHYAGSGANTATFCHGLFHRSTSQCLGVAWWIPPTRSAAEATVKDALLRGYANGHLLEGDERWQRVLALSRLVVVPGCPTNSASYLMAASRRLVAASGQWDLLVTYADTWQGHTGAIYRADNWEHVGIGKPEAVWVDGNGRMVARKAGPVTRTTSEMEALGYRRVGAFAKEKFLKIVRQE